MPPCVPKCVRMYITMCLGLFTTPDDFGEQNDSLDWQPGRPRPLLPASAAAYIQAKEAKDSLLVSAGLDDQVLHFDWMSEREGEIIHDLFCSFVSQLVS